ncbi:hypothetical protein LJR118_002178 [Acidovorax sp. LjRoot118]|uniref:hypothetical protein n=1 Tax=Acidovorax sp. LjRoot118 TaxID=3342256 RepID=UPI003ECE808B
MTFNVPTILNASDKGAGVLLSNGDLTVTAGTAAGIARSLTKVSSGKWYVEFNRTVGSWMLGIASSSATLSQYPGANNQSMGLFAGSLYYNGSTVEAVGALSATGVFGMAIDADARTLRIFNATGTTTSRAIPFAGDIYLAAGSDSASLGGNLTLNAGASAFTYSVPSGFTPGFALRTAYGMAGNVKDASNANAARTIRGHNRATGVLTCSTVSDASTGNFLLIPFPNSTAEHSVEAFPVSTSEPSLIFDRVVPG